MINNGFRLLIINCKRRSVVVFYRTKAGNASISLRNLENLIHNGQFFAIHELNSTTCESEWLATLALCYYSPLRMLPSITVPTLTPSFTHSMEQSLEKVLSSKSRNSEQFMVHRDTLPCKLQPENGPYSKLHQTSLQPPTLFL